MDQADLYFAADILRLLNSHPAEFTVMPRFRISALMFSDSDNFGEITFNSTKSQWEFSSPVDESNFAIFDYGHKITISKDEKKYIKKHCADSEPVDITTCGKLRQVESVTNFRLCNSR